MKRREEGGWLGMGGSPGPAAGAAPAQGPPASGRMLVGVRWVVPTLIRCVGCR